MAGRVLRVLPGAWAVIEMRQDALDHHWIFDAGNHLHLPATGFANLNVTLEHPLQALRLRLIDAWRSTGGACARAAWRRPRRAGVTCSRRG